MKPNGKANKGVSTVVGSVLFMILIASVTSTLYLTMFQFNKSTNSSIAEEQKRTQEKIIIDQMTANDMENPTLLTSVRINNTGPSAVRIRAVYIDSSLAFEADQDINPKETAWIQMPANTPFVPYYRVTVATERGVKSVGREGDFIYPKEDFNENQDLYFGPLRLNYEEFYYCQYDSSGNPLPPGWKSGWAVPAHTEIVWKIEVKNVDDRSIILNKYSTFTLISNDGGVQDPWYIEKMEHPENGRTDLRVNPDETVRIIYRWDTSKQTKTENTPNPCLNRLFLTFYGVFIESWGTKPYGQTIPFEAVEVI